MQYPKSKYDAGFSEADKARTLSDYDTSMVLGVLNYAELWPFLSGNKWPSAITRIVDREVFYGPYGRWADGVSWDSTTPAPITDRGASITGIYIRGWDDIDGLSIQRGGAWDGAQGSSSGGAPKEISIGKDEYITSVDVTSGYKLGKLAFKTNKNNSLSNGNARHADTDHNAAPPGYALTSVRVTRYVAHVPPGCEGVILGFRPLITDSSVVL